MSADKILRRPEVRKARRKFNQFIKEQQTKNRSLDDYVDLGELIDETWWLSDKECGECGGGRNN